VKTGRVLQGGTVRRVVLDDGGASVRDLEPGGSTYPIDAVRVLAPVTPHMVIGVNSAVKRPRDAPAPIPGTVSEHMLRMRDSRCPYFFHKAVSSITAPGEPIVFAPEFPSLMMEAEVALVIGRRCSRVDPDRAWDYVSGVTIVNDVTVPEYCLEDDDFYRAKSQPGFCPIGPWIDSDMSESAIVDGLDITTKINSEVASTASTAQLRFTPSQVVSHGSYCMILDVGDVVHLGCVAPVIVRQPGAVCTIEITRLGTLENPIVAGT
jgi:2-keto-4-pentenoate hydratase/2-oxohepta-3-ene-1,7-dioic acid hydratase in catechol pathway